MSRLQTYPTNIKRQVEPFLMCMLDTFLKGKRVCLALRDRFVDYEYRQVSAYKFCYAKNQLSINDISGEWFRALMQFCTCS